MTPYRASLLLGACLLLSVVCPGCVTPSPPLPLPAPERSENSGAERILQYYAQLRGLSAEALQQERLQQESALTYSRSHEVRLKLVCVLSVPDATTADTTYALTLLQEYFQAQEPQPVELYALATLLHNVLQSKEQSAAVAMLQKKLQEALLPQEKPRVTPQHMHQKLQEELAVQKALNTTLQKQVQEAVHAQERQTLLQRQLNKKLQDEKKNVRKLQDKIEKIQDIEKSLIEKERTDNKGT